MDEHKNLIGRIKNHTEKDKMRVNDVGYLSEPTKHKETIIDDPMKGIENMMNEEDEKKEKYNYIFKIEHLLNTTTNIPDFSLKDDFKKIATNNTRFRKFQERLYKFENIKEIKKYDKYFKVDTGNMSFFDYGVYIEVKSINDDKFVFLRSLIKLISYITIKYYIIQGFNKNEEKHCYFRLSFQNNDNENVELLILFDCLYNNKENNNFTIEFTDNQRKILKYYKDKNNFYRNIGEIKNEINKQQK